MSCRTYPRRASATLTASDRTQAAGSSASSWAACSITAFWAAVNLTRICSSFLLALLFRLFTPLMWH